MIKITDEEKSNLYENIITNNWDAIVFANMDGIVEFLNPAASTLYGYEEDELIGQNVDVFNSHLTLNTADIVQSIIDTGRWHGELIQRKKDDSTFDALLHVQIITDNDGNPIGYASNSKDVSQERESAKRLKQTISEKEILIKEIHHRVKNNLATVQGILRLQIESAKESDLDNFLIDFQTRLSVLAEAHNNLSTSTSLQEIDLGAYVHQIAKDVAKLFQTADKKITLEMDIESTEVSMDQAIPIGLIANEIITNSFKHAFKNSPADGVLHVSLLKKASVFQLNIKDSGVGFDFDAKMITESLGMSLVDGLASQVNADYQFESNKGCSFMMEFALN